MKRMIIFVVSIVIVLLIVIICLSVRKNEEYKKEINNNTQNSIYETERLQTETTFADNKVKDNHEKENQEDNLKNIEDIKLYDVDGKETNYIFTYKNIDFTAIYTKDNWKIIDSYKITNKKDMEIICSALINVHPIHGKDKVSYRTPQDLVSEWKLHNLAFALLPEDSKWKSNAKDVDLNPEDQGKSLEEFFNSRITE